MTSPRQTDAQREAIRDLKSLQQELTQNWIDRSLPKDWNGFDSRAPVTRDKTRITIRLDADMVRWFRKLGPGYQTRINDVLRIYWNALIGGWIKSHWDEDEVAPAFTDMILRMADARSGETVDEAPDQVRDGWGQPPS